MKMKQKTKKILFFFLSILLLLSVGTLAYSFSPLSPFDVNEGNIYITSGDVIRNFKLETFDGQTITSGGTVMGLDDRLKFELGAQWTADPEDIKLRYAEQVGEEVFVNYEVTFTNAFNLYTNVGLDDTVETGKTIDAITESLGAGSYAHYGCFGGDEHILWSSYLDFNHLDVGDIRTHNAEYNTFSGDLEMSFDIDTSPLPDSLVDANGNTANKNFDYIGVSAIYVKNSTYGSLSHNVPESVGLTPATYDFSRSSVSGGAPSQIAGGFEAKWNPSPVLGDQFVSNTADLRIQPQSIGSSLNPTLKDGSQLYNPEIAEESTPNCKFSYNIGSLSPLVREYSRTLSWYSQTLRTQDILDYVFPLGISYHVGVTYDINEAVSVTRPVALHVENRYIHNEIAITFNIWSSYQVVAIESDLPELQFPEEYYDELVFDSTVDGFGGAYLYKEEFEWGIGMTEFIGIIIIVIVIGVIALVVYLMYRRYVTKKAMKSVQVMGGNTVK